MIRARVRFDTCLAVSIAISVQLISAEVSSLVGTGKRLVRDGLAFGTLLPTWLPQSIRDCLTAFEKIWDNGFRQITTSDTQAGGPHA